MQIGADLEIWKLSVPECQQDAGYRNNPFLSDSLLRAPHSATQWLQNSEWKKQQHRGADSSIFFEMRKEADTVYLQDLWLTGCVGCFVSCSVQYSVQRTRRRLYLDSAFYNSLYSKTSLCFVVSLNIVNIWVVLILTETDSLCFFCLASSSRC